MDVMPTFKMMEAGMIPGDWEVTKLGKHASFRTGPFGSALHRSDYVEGGVPVINPMQIIDGRIHPTSSMAVTEKAAKKLSEFRLAAGDIVIGRRGEMGRCAVVQSHAAGWLCGTGSMILRVGPSLDGRFIQRVLSSPPIIAAIENASVGSTMINLNQGTLGNLLVPLPPTKAEQEAIAEALSDADALIESLEQLIVKKRQIKQGAMQELLTGKKRLPGFSGEWEVKRLGELGSTFGGLSGKSKSDFGIGPSRYITFMNIMTNVVIDCGIFERVMVSPTEFQNRVTKGDLFFNGSSETPEEVGMCAVLAEDVQDVYLNSFCFGFRCREGTKASGLYLAYYFRSGEGRELLESLAQGSTRYNLSKIAFLKVTFPLPPAREQIEIASVLSDMDTEIAALEVKLAKARQLKQGMMQELLTGRTRLI
jgi:type I restriction enzyme S subunit